MKNSAVIMCILISCVAIVSFTVLAVLFNHWWIALFAYFFTYTYKHTEGSKEN